MTQNDSIIIYQTSDGKNTIEVSLLNDSVWLSLNQISSLFERDKSVVSRHIRKILQENELDKDATVAFFATVQSEGKRSIERTIEYYNLDMIISVGYRVNSKRGTQFRMWASSVLKDHLLKGYSLNEKRLLEQKEKIMLLASAISLIENTASNQPIELDEAKALIKVVSDYAYGLGILDDYDHQRTEVKASTIKPAYILSYDECKQLIERMKRQFDSDLFGAEKDDSFKGSIGAIYQTFDEKEVYPSLEEKASNLLYFIVKNHSFVDGNKRIAAAIFLYFLSKNNILYREDGSKRLADNTLVAITLMIAESRSDEKSNIISVMINLINQNNV